MFAVAYYTLFLLAILAPVGAYCYRVEQRDNNNEQLMTLEVATKLPLVIPMSEIGIDAYADQDNY